MAILIRRGVPPPSGLNAATTAWVSAVIANGGTVSAGRQTTVNNLIVSLKNDGIWTKLDRLWLLAAENTPSALTDLVGLTLAVANGSPTFTTDRGYTGVDASTTVYIETGFNATTAPSPNFVRDSAHLSAWSTTSAVSGGAGGCYIGNDNAATGCSQIQGRYVGDIAVFRANTSNGITPASTDGSGHFITNRSGASTEEGYRNGSALGTGTGASQLPENLTMKILGLGAPGVGSGAQITMASIGSSLSSGDATNFYNDLRTYMTAVGVP